MRGLGSARSRLPFEDASTEAARPRNKADRRGAVSGSREAVTMNTMLLIKLLAFAKTLLRGVTGNLGVRPIPRRRELFVKDLFHLGSDCAAG